MAKPIENNPTAGTSDLTPAHRIIETLRHPALNPGQIHSSPKNTTTKESFEVLPLTEEELQPSGSELKALIGQTLIWMGAISLIMVAWVYGLLIFSRTPTRLPIEGMTDKETVFPVVSTKAPLPPARQLQQTSPRRKPSTESRPIHREKRPKVA